MDFDPDAYLASKEKSVAAPAEFDPDAYLASKQKAPDREPSWYDKAKTAVTGEKFDPQSKPGYIQDIVQSAPGAVARFSSGLAGIPSSLKSYLDAHDPTDPNQKNLTPEEKKRLLEHESMLKKYNGNNFREERASDPNMGELALTGLKSGMGSMYQDPQTTPGKIADFALQNVIGGAKNPRELLNAPQNLKNLIQGTVAGAAGEAVPDNHPVIKALVQAGTGAVASGGTTAMKNLVRGSEKEAGTSAATVAQNAKEAHEAGYVVPPAQVTDSKISDTLGGWSGKKIEQKASIKNQENTNGLVKQEFGLPKDAVLDEKTFSDVRKDAGKAYKAVQAVTMPMKTDTGFRNRIASIGGANSQAAKEFPDLMANPEIDNLRKTLIEQKPFTTKGAIEVVKQLRGDATKNLKTIGDPSKHALGLAQREAANAVDDLVERNLDNMGHKDLVKEYRVARQTIAKAHDMESITNTTTGNVSARGAARLMDKGKPLTGNLEKVAKFGAAFPKSAQSPDVLGSVTDSSALDFGLSLTSVAHGRPDIGAAILARPIARNMALSKGYQDTVFSPKEKVPTGTAPLTALIKSTEPKEDQP